MFPEGNSISVASIPTTCKARRGPCGGMYPVLGLLYAAACEGASKRTWITLPTCTPSSCCSVDDASTWSGFDGSGSWPETSEKGDLARPGTTATPKSLPSIWCAQSHVGFPASGRMISVAEVTPGRWATPGTGMVA